VRRSCRSRRASRARSFTQGGGYTTDRHSEEEHEVYVKAEVLEEEREVYVKAEVSEEEREVYVKA
jgi:hypothetical protein